MLARPRPKVAIYGRHSTVMQTATSSNDQAASCGKLVDYLQGIVVATYLDPEQSGYRRNRPGLKQLIRAIEEGEIDTVICESLDRLARDAEDVAWVGKKLSFHRVQLHTVSEGHVDEIKFAVAGLLGAIFLKHLIDKTLRGMEAAVLAGRFAGGRAYGYKRVTKLDAKGELIRGLIEIDPETAPIVRRIFNEFAAGRSAIQIAKALNEEGVPGPRGGQWNASTIRGDPKKLVGILNNPLYVGRLVWGRRQWRKNPDSERRERVYRLREQSEWIEVAVPDLRILSDEEWETARAEISRRARDSDAKAPAGKPRAKHLLSGLIRCSVCGSNYTISGKDYYRCAGEKERGTCGNRVSVRKAPIEAATLAILQSHLLHDEHARIFVEEFHRETQKLERAADHRDERAQGRLRELETELANLTQNLLAGLASPTLMAMIADRESEKQRLQTITAPQPAVRRAGMLPHSVLLKRFEEKVATLRAALDDETVRTEAAAVLATLIESVTIYPDGERGPEAEVVAKMADLMSFAANENTRRSGRFDGRSVTVVAGAGFEPATFRL
jgi:site-specific DNA recombinase